MFHRGKYSFLVPGSRVLWISDRELYCTAHFSHLTFLKSGYVLKPLAYKSFMAVYHLYLVTSEMMVNITLDGILDL